MLIGNAEDDAALPFGALSFILFGWKPAAPPAQARAERQLRFAASASTATIY